MKARYVFLLTLGMAYAGAWAYVSQMPVSTFAPVQRWSMVAAGQYMASSEARVVPEVAQKAAEEQAEAAEWGRRIMQRYGMVYLESPQYWTDKVIEGFARFPVALFRMFVPTDDVKKAYNPEGKKFLEQPVARSWLADVMVKFAAMALIVAFLRILWRKLWNGNERRLSKGRTYSEDDFDSMLARQGYAVNASEPARAQVLDKSAFSSATPSRISASGVAPRPSGFGKRR